MTVVGLKYLLFYFRGLQFLERVPVSVVHRPGPTPGSDGRRVWIKELGMDWGSDSLSSTVLVSWC